MQPIQKVESDLDKLADTTSEPERNHAGPYTTERGVVITYKKVPSETIRRAWDSMEVPKVPMVWIEDRGRLEPNPVDPGYNAEIEKYNAKRSMIVNTVYLMFGTEIDTIPAGIPGPEEPSWHEGLELFIDIPTGKMALKTSWLLHYILADGERDEVVEDLMLFSGAVPEKRVKAAEDSFRNNGKSEADIPVQDSK